MSPAFEATAPCRVDLSIAQDAVSIAIDRRVSCRVETDVDGIALESKDTLQRVQGARLSDLGAVASLPLVLAREALRALAQDGGVRVVTQVKVPAPSGLGGETALAVALVGALARAAGRDVAQPELASLAGGVVAAALGRPPAAVDVVAALRGGVVATVAGGEPTLLTVDPAAIEECLLLVEAGPSFETDGDALAEPEGHGARVRAALVGHHFDALAAALSESWDVHARTRGWATEERSRVARCLRPAGAGLRACGGGRGTVVAVVAAPGPRGPGRREAVAGAAREAGLRLFRARVDLLGLDVEKVG